MYKMIAKGTWSPRDYFHMTKRIYTQWEQIHSLPTSLDLQVWHSDFNYNNSFTTYQFGFTSVAQWFQLLYHSFTAYQFGFTSVAQWFQLLYSYHIQSYRHIVLSWPSHPSNQRSLTTGVCPCGVYPCVDQNGDRKFCKAITRNCFIPNDSVPMEHQVFAYRDANAGDVDSMKPHPIPSASPDGHTTAGVLAQMPL